MRESIGTLAEFPYRCPLAPENANHEEEIRHLVFGDYRILFMVNQDVVFILHVRHCARLPLEEPE